jgi:hypothetical protein
MFEYKKNKTLSDHNKPKAKLNLKITDFGKQEIIPIPELTDRIQHIPSFHLENLDEILYDPQRFTPKIISDSLEENHGNAQGVYIQSHRMIVIYYIESKRQLSHVLFHELGHHVYFRVISQALKIKWVKDICRNDRFITKYASRNAAEDFAESYVAYLNEPEKLKTIPLKYHFMRKHVFQDVDSIMSDDKLDFKA